MTVEQEQQITAVDQPVVEPVDAPVATKPVPVKAVEGAQSFLSFEMN
jgi:hypothetical protein